MKLLTVLKAKALVTAIAGVLLVGGATAAFAATPAGQNVVQSLTHGQSSTTAAATHGAQNGGQHGKSDQDHNACPGMAEAQNLATKYHLSSDGKGDAVTAICALHKGTFKGSTTSGASVTVSRVYGYGEIDQLLTYAQSLAKHDSATLSDTNVSGLLATALHNCGTSPIEVCVRTNVSGNQHGSDGNGNKPTTTPTPNGNKPPVTPTPHH